MKKVLLYSGGMDSWLIDKLWTPDLKLYVNMHTDYSKKEIHNLKNQKINVKICDFPLNQWEQSNKVIPLRNLYLLMVACNETRDEDVEICLGATVGDRIYDKTLPFAHNSEKLLNDLYNPGTSTGIAHKKNVKINFNYKNYSKTQLLKEYLEKGGSIEQAFNNTISCYDENETHCWDCKPCFRKYLAFKLNGYPFEESVDRSMFRYFLKEIFPDMENKTLEEYDRGEEGEEFLKYYYSMKNQFGEKINHDKN